MDYLEEREKQARLEYEIETKSAKEKLDKILAAIQVLRGEGDITAYLHSRRTIKPTHRKAAPKITPRTAREEGTIPEIVKKTVVQMTGSFGSLQAFEKSIELYPDAKLSAKSFMDTLSRLAIQPDSGIVIDVPRHGRIPAKYKVINPTLFKIE